MASSAKVRLNFAPNQNHRDVKPALVEKMDFPTLLKTASNKLRVKAKRLFTDEGQEISVDNLSSFKVCQPKSHQEVYFADWKGEGTLLTFFASSHPSLCSPSLLLL
jgi:hypothetical protein